MDGQLCRTEDIDCSSCCIMHGYYIQEGSGENNDIKELHGKSDVRLTVHRNSV